MVPISVRYSPDLKRVSVEPSSDSRGQGGCASLTQIWETLPPVQDSPLYAINAITNAVSDVPTGTWLLTEDLYIEHGITLRVMGSARGGDADEVRLLSNSETFLSLRGNGGSLAFEDTRVLSWDDAIGGPDEDISDGRSSVSCLSEVATDDSLSLSCEGRAEATIKECRMDIRQSQMAYLGYEADESWGLSSIVRGFCKGNSNPEMFDSVVSVRTTIIDSDLHHNYHGCFALGSVGGDWTGNTVHHNVRDGFHAREYSRNLAIEGNDVRDNGNHGIVGAEQCSDFKIFENIVVNNKIGIVLRDLGNRATVQRNYVAMCSEAGIAMQGSSYGVVAGNMLMQNAINLRVSSGSTDNLFDSNVIRRGTEYDISVYDGTDPLVHRDSGRPNNNVFFKNKFEGPRRDDGGVHITNADGIQFVENLIFDGPWHFRIEDSAHFVFSGNHGYDRVSTSLDGDSCVDPVSDFGWGKVCPSANVALYRASDVFLGTGALSPAVKPAVADMFGIGSYSSASSSSSSSFSSSYMKMLGEDSKPPPSLPMYSALPRGYGEAAFAAGAVPFGVVEANNAYDTLDNADTKKKVFVVGDARSIGEDKVITRGTAVAIDAFSYWCAVALVVVCLLAWSVKQAWNISLKKGGHATRR